ncbi:hypothetical protein LEN26_016395 [Aphanomyces euteiches]|nr:hypothetical protein LEN26_016395 [Aphanomyces euteiches]
MAPSLGIPDDAIIQIAFYLQDPSHLFAWLEALGPALRPDPLECLWKLGLTKQHADLWPQLVISMDDLSLDPTTRSALESIAKYYTDVRLINFVDLPWLHSNIHPLALQTWHFDSDIPTSPPFSWTIWASMRITRLYLSDLSDDMILVEILPQLHHLTAFQLNLPSGCRAEIPIESILAWAASSAQLTELELFTPCASIRLTERMVSHLVDWFQRQPVRVFGFSYWGFHHQVNDPDVVHAFYSTLFNCPTMDLLTCHFTDLNGVNWTDLTISTRRFELSACNMSSDIVTALATQLTNSARLEHFILHGYDDPNMAGIEHFFSVVPRMLSLKVLDLSYCHFESKTAWQTLAPLVQAFQVDTLIFCGVKLTPDAAQWLAHALLANDTIQALDIRYNYVGFEGAKTLIQTNLKRRVRLVSIRLEYNSIRQCEKPLLQDVATQCGVQILTL